jgi:hypothetical protein
MAREQELPVLEAETVLQELRAVLLDVEPDIAEDHWSHRTRAGRSPWSR